MSFDAIKWALGQPVEKSSAKFLLVAMANCVNGDAADMLCWASVKALSDLTSQDRKTVMDGLQRLRADGFIKDTGERKGGTGQIPVYLLKSPEIGTVKQAREPQPATPPVAANSPENGTGPENGTVPFFPPNSTVFPSKESRFSLETVPKTGHGTTKEPVRNQEGTKKRGVGFDASLIDLPEWMDREDWERWCKDRRTRGKPITEDAAQLQVKNLAKYRKEGFTATEVIEHSISSGYQGLYPPKRIASKTPTSSRRGGFREIDYEEGLTDGIPDA